jgi:hypothetical protein
MSRSAEIYPDILPIFNVFAYRYNIYMPRLHDDALMKEKRREERKFLTYFSRVIDRNNGRMLGYLVDLTTGGAQLVGNIPLKLQNIFLLRIDLPEGFASIAYLDMEAKAVWSQPDVDPEFFRTGLQMMSVSDDQAETLRHLLDQYGARGD